MRSPLPTHKTARSTLRVGMWTLWHDRELLPQACQPRSQNLLANLRAMRCTLTVSTSRRPRRGQCSHAYWVRQKGKRNTHLARRPSHAHGSRRNRHAAQSGNNHRPQWSARHRGHAAGRELCRARRRQRKRPGRQPRIPEGSRHRGPHLCAARGPRPRGLRPLRLDALPASALGRKSRRQQRRTQPRSPQPARRSGSTARVRSPTSAKTAVAARPRPTEIWPRAHAVPYLPSQPDRYCTAGGRQRVGLGD